MKKQQHSSTIPYRIAILTFLGLGMLAAVPRAAAHPADMYYHVHTLQFTSTGITADWAITPGTMLAYAVWDDADTNGDEAVSADEARLWLEPRVRDLYTLTVDDQAVRWQIDSVDWPTSLVEFELGTEPVTVHLSTTWRANSATAHQISLNNRFETLISSNWFYLHGDGGIAFRTPEQDNGQLTVEVVSSGDTSSDATTYPYWDSGTPGLKPGEVVVPKTPPKPSSASSTLTKLVTEDRMTLPFILGALGISLGFGAIHALTPGHGKALVGAYLVGSRGTMKHAIALGSIVTITHTGSVLTLGMITLVASHILVPEKVFPLLEATSGLLVVAMGVMLGYRRWQAWQSVRAAHQRQSIHHTKNTEIQKVKPKEKQIPSRTIAINQPIKVNVYDDVLPTRTETAASMVNWRALITLGISGGLVPCPDAIAILLVAVTINRIVLGLSLIMAFSLGLAGILTGLGIAMVRSRTLFERFNAFSRVVPALPLISAIAVTGLGLALTYSALTRPGFLSQQAEALDLDSDAARPFALDEARVVYLDTDAGDRYQLYVIDAMGGDPVQLTDAPYGVWDFAIQPEMDAETSIAYSAPRQYGGSDIWLLDLANGEYNQLLECVDVTCSRPLWSPDGERLVYERLMPDEVSPQTMRTTIWWLDPTSKVTGPVFQDDQFASFSASWSPDGQWLSYISPDSASAQLYHLAERRHVTIPSRVGKTVAWKPDSTALLIADVVEQNEENFVHMLHYDLTSETLSDLTLESIDQSVGDNWASWSPDGQWIAVVRRVYDGTSLGDQVWVMRPDGRDARMLTDAPDVIHDLPVWSPDSQYLLVQRYALAGIEGQSGLWFLNVESGEQRHITLSGNDPAWLVDQG